jgi:hypothetical protein
VSTVQAIRTDTSPMHVAGAGESIVAVSHIASKSDWTKPEAYLPQTNMTTLSADMNAAIRVAGGTMSFDARISLAGGDVVSYPPGAGRSRLLQGLSVLKDAERVMIVLDEANITATANTFSAIYNGPRLTIDNTVTSIWLPDDLVLDFATPDPLAGYEKHHVANWDQFDADPITPETLAYARRLMRVMPTSLGAPDIAPAADGSIALEWVPEDSSSKLHRLFLDIGPGLEWRAYWRMRNGTFDRIAGQGFDGAKATLKNLFDKLSA